MRETLRYTALLAIRGGSAGFFQKKVGTAYPQRGPRSKARVLPQGPPRSGFAPALLPLACCVQARASSLAATSHTWLWHLKRD